MSSRAASSSDNSPLGGVRLDALSLSDGDEPKHLQPAATYYEARSRSAGATPTFAVNTLTSRDDVFASPSEAGPSSRVSGERAVTTPAGVLQRQEVAVASNQTLDTPPHPGLRARSSNLTSSRHHVHGVDAQGIYPPTACVFVANLPQTREDQALEAAVTREFSRFGTVFVKIRRDNQNMPFAFCQFTRDEDARDAMENGRGSMILGRACRTEMVRANRTFIIYRHTGEIITVNEASDLMSPHGVLSRCEPLAQRLQVAQGLPPSVIVEFAMFDPARDIQSAFRNDRHYRVAPYDSNRNVLTTRQTTDEAYLASYETDRRSIWVGNLPGDIAEDTLRGMFGSVGDVVHVNIIHRADNYHENVFGFVEFSEADMPDAAIERFHQYNLRGNHIIVQRKKSRDQTPQARRARSQNFGGSYHTPTGTSRRPAYTPTGRAAYTPGSGEYGSHTLQMQPQPSAPSFNWVTAQPVTEQTGYMPSPYGMSTNFWQPVFPMGYTPNYPHGYQPEAMPPGYFPPPAPATYVSPAPPAPQPRDRSTHTPTRSRHSDAGHGSHNSA